MNWMSECTLVCIVMSVDTRYSNNTRSMIGRIIEKISLHSSCEIEDFVETHLSLQAVCDSDRAYHGLCVLIKDIGRRLPLQRQCSYQGEQGDVGQSVRGNYKTCF